MGILSKLFGKGQAGANAEPSVAAAAPRTAKAIITQAPPRAGASDRAPRVEPQPLHGVSFEVTESPAQLAPILALANISASGAGFLRSSSEHWPEPGSILKGTFLFKNERFPATLKIVHASSYVIGCSYVEGRFELGKMVSNYFALEIAAMTLTQVNPAMLQAVNDGQPLWLLGTHRCEIYLVVSGPRLVRFNMTVLGNYIESLDGICVRAGLVIEEERGADKPSFRGSSLIRWESRISPELLEMAERFVGRALQLSAVQREQLLEVLRRAR